MTLDSLFLFKCITYLFLWAVHYFHYDKVAPMKGFVFLNIRGWDPSYLVVLLLLLSLLLLPGVRVVYYYEHSSHQALHSRASCPLLPCLLLSLSLQEISVVLCSLSIASAQMDAPLCWSFSLGGAVTRVNYVERRPNKHRSPDNGTSYTRDKSALISCQVVLAASDSFFSGLASRLVS